MHCLSCHALEAHLGVTACNVMLPVATSLNFEFELNSNYTLNFTLNFKASS